MPLKPARETIISKPREADHRYAGAGTGIGWRRCLLQARDAGAILVVVSLLSAQGSSVEARQIRWQAFGTLSLGGSGHASALTENEVLVTGGRNQTPTDLFDPVAAAWEKGPPMTEARDKHTATSLKSGKVLVVAGIADEGLAATAEVYDPDSRSWKPAGKIPPRFNHTATLLKNGKVLVTGGQASGHGPFLNDAWLYEPDTNEWRPAGTFEQGRSLHAAALLPDGRVLLTGGRAVAHGFALREATIYDPGSNSWQTVPRLMQVERAQHSATSLPDGNVLIIGGTRTPGGDPGMPVKSDQLIAAAEAFMPGSATFVSVAPPLRPRYAHSALALKSGKVLVAGGAVFRPLSSADPETTLVEIDDRAPNETYDPAGKRWSRDGSTPGGSSGTFTLTELSKTPCAPNCGKVVVVAATNQQTRTFLYSPDSQQTKREGPGKGQPATVAGVAAALMFGAAIWAIRHRRHS